jgi:hypothetical protein
MIKRLALLGALAVTTMTAGGMAIPSGASAGCWPKANAPYYESGTVKARGKIQCSAPRTWIQVIGRLYRNGTVVDTDSSYCGGVSRCNVTPAYPNSSGNQVWCMEVEGHYGWFGPTSGEYVGRDVACEAEGFLALEAPLDIGALDSTPMPAVL